jgi:hypothetical protein
MRPGQDRPPQEESGARFPQARLGLAARESQPGCCRRRERDPNTADGTETRRLPGTSRGGEGSRPARRRLGSPTPLVVRPEIIG